MPPMPLATSESLGNLVDEDDLLMPPPPLPQDLALETDMVTQPPVDELSLDDPELTPLSSRLRHPHASTPLQTYRPQLPAINEESQRPPTMGRVLELSEHSPSPTPNVAAAASAAIPPAARPEILSISRDWTSIFRPREVAINYEELDEPQPRLKRRRIVRRNPPESNDIEQRSNQEITTGFMAELLQTAAQEAELPIDAVAVQQPFNETPRTQYTSDAQIDQPMQIPETYKIVLPQEISEMPMDIELSTSSAICNDLPERAIVTSVQIIYQPDSLSLNDVNRPEISSTLGPTSMLTASTRLLEESVASVENSPPKQQSVQERVYGKNIDDLAYIVEHTEMLRVMVDHQKELSDKQEQTKPILADFEKSSDGESETHYISMPALYTYDPKIVINMPALKQRVVHSLMGALIMSPKVDMRSAPFIKTRLEAAIVFRVLFELKAANIINLSQNGQIASLR